MAATTTTAADAQLTGDVDADRLKEEHQKAEERKKSKSDQNV